MAKKKKQSRSNWMLIGIAIVALIIFYLIVQSNNSNNENMPEVLSPPSGIPRGQTEEGLFYLGNEEAEIVLRIYEDYACPNCRIFYLTSEERLIEEYIQTGNVRLEIFPIAFVNSRSLPAAEAVYCAADQDLFWEYRALAYHNQGQIDFTSSNLIELASQIDEIDIAEFTSCYNQNRFQDVLMSRTNLAVGAGVEGTPTFEVGGQRYPSPGEITLPDIFELLDSLIVEE